MKPGLDIEQALIPAEYSCLGIRLRPFSLGHLLLLRAIRSPYLGSGPMLISRNDTLTAAIICGMNFNDGLDLVRGRKIRAMLKEWQKAVPRKWLLFRMKFDWEKAEAVMLDYIIDGMRKPNIWQHEGNGIVLSSPWEQILKLKLLAGGFSLDYIFNAYLPLLYYDFYALVEKDQAEKVKTAEQWRNVFITKEEEAVMAKRN